MSNARRDINTATAKQVTGITGLDVLLHPRQALENRVLATPTPIIVGPHRRLRYMGILDDSQYVLEPKTGSEPVSQNGL